MWIKSQDRKILLDTHDFRIVPKYKKPKYNERNSMFEDMEINGYRIVGREVELGIYNTEERALEVLNDIHKDIETCTHCEHYDYRYQDSEHFLDTKRISHIVYQMPEK